MDLESLFQVLETNAKLRDTLPVLSQEVAIRGIHDAFEALQNVPDNALLGTLSTPACLVISLLQQYIVRHLCKHMMQLMTPESLISNRKKIPSSYIENYLVHQKHFSFKDLLVKHFSLAQR